MLFWHEENSMSVFKYNLKKRRLLPPATNCDPPLLLDVLEHCEGLLRAERSGEIEEWRKPQNLQNGS
jgi:hypothetical protein